MVSNYRIEDVHIFDETVFMRNVSLQVGGKKLDQFARALNRRVDMSTLTAANQKFGSNINELYMRLDLQTLRKIDEDPDEQAKFIRAKTKFLERGQVNMFFLRLLVRVGERLTDDDINYLNMLLLYQLNDVYTIPIIEFEGEFSHQERKEKYDAFVKRILALKNSSVPGQLRTAISVPAYYPRKMIGELFDLYRNENKDPSLVVVDFAGMRLTDPKRISVIPQITQVFENEKDEKYFLYGLNVRPYRRGTETPVAEDFYMVQCGFNSFGDTYRKPAPITLPPPDWNQSKIFWPEDYKYHDLTGTKERAKWHDWIDVVYGSGARSDYAVPNSRMNMCARRYNFYSLNDELSVVSDGVRKSDKNLIRSRVLSKEIPDEMLSAIKTIRGK